MANNPYTPPTLSNYNANPPSDDGSQTDANEIAWVTHTDKIGDPLRNFSNAIDDAVLAGFAKTINTDADENNSVAGSIAFTPSELTIDTGSVAAVRSHHTIDTENDDAADDLDTITVAGVDDGTVLILRLANAARVVTLKDGTGNLQLKDNKDIVLDANFPTTLIRIGTDWVQKDNPFNQNLNKADDVTFDAIISTGGITVNTISERTAAAGVTVDGVLLKDGGLTVTALMNGLAIVNQSGAFTGGFTFGADSNATTLTNSTTKIGRQVGPHFTNTEEAIFVQGYSSDGSENNRILGGSAGVLNAINNHQWYTAATDTTLTGTLRMQLVADGGLIVGSPSGASQGAGTINASGVFDDGVLLTCYVGLAAQGLPLTDEEWDVFAPDRIHPAIVDESGEVLKKEVIEKRVHEGMRKFRKRNENPLTDPLDLDVFYKHFMEKGHLTPFPNKENYLANVMSTGQWLQTIIELSEIQAVHIEKLNQKDKDQQVLIDSLITRIEALETK